MLKKRGCIRKQVRLEKEVVLIKGLFEFDY
jgi:hypothetical protein